MTINAPINYTIADNAALDGVVDSAGQKITDQNEFVSSKELYAKFMKLADSNAIEFQY